MFQLVSESVVDRMTASVKTSVGFNFFYVILFFSTVTIASFVSPDPEVEVQLSLKELIRRRRQVCLDGTYQHEGRNCCLCPAGQRVIQHCTSNPEDGKCDFCEPQTYSSHPNSQTSCKLCTSCDHQNANLEVEEKCTSYGDAKCRCKENHFCSTDTQPCKVCQPCVTCGPEKACIQQSNPACSKTSYVGAIVGSILGVLLVLAAIAAGLMWWKMKQRKSPEGEGNSEMQPIRVSDMDMQPFLPEVAEKLGWSNMKKIAIQSGIPLTTIDNVKLNYPQDSEEWTLELLRKWVETKGKRAPRELIEMLRRRGKNDTAERILAILPNSSV